MIGYGKIKLHLASLLSTLSLGDPVHRGVTLEREGWLNEAESSSIINHVGVCLCHRLWTYHHLMRLRWPNICRY